MTLEQVLSVSVVLNLTTTWLGSLFLISKSFLILVWEGTVDSGSDLAQTSRMFILLVSAWALGPHRNPHYGGSLLAPAGTPVTLPA